jgi:hypothetical protein
MPALICEAWMGPHYQVTSRVNVVNPDGQAQVVHRDYHLGFIDREQALAYLAQAHLLSAALTLQGAVAHCDMPGRSAGGLRRGWWRGRAGLLTQPVGCHSMATVRLLLCGSATRDGERADPRPGRAGRRAPADAGAGGGEGLCVRVRRTRADPLSETNRLRKALEKGDKTR